MHALRLRSGVVGVLPELPVRVAYAPPSGSPVMSTVRAPASQGTARTALQPVASLLQHPARPRQTVVGLELVADLAEHPVEHRRTEREEQPAAQQPRQEDPHHDHDFTAEPRPLLRTEGAIPVAAGSGTPC